MREGNIFSLFTPGGGTPILPEGGRYPIWHFFTFWPIGTEWGYPLSGLDGDTPLLDWMETSGDRAAERALATRRTLCFLRSCKRTFLLMRIFGEWEIINGLVISTKEKVKFWKLKKFLYRALVNWHCAINPFDECEQELIIPNLLEQPSIFAQTLREAPSDPHVQGLGKHVYVDKSPSDTHCWNELLVLTALETWTLVWKIFNRYWWIFTTEYSTTMAIIDWNDLYVYFTFKNYKYKC